MKPEAFVLQNKNLLLSYSDIFSMDRSTYLLDLYILAQIIQGTTKIQIICMKCSPNHILDYLHLRHLFSTSISTARIYVYCLTLLFFKFFFFLKRGVSYHTLLYIDKTFTTSQHRYFSTNHTQFTKIDLIPLFSPKSLNEKSMVP